MFAKIAQTIFSVYDLIKLYFFNYDKHAKKKEHLLINEEINLDEGI